MAEDPFGFEFRLADPAPAADLFVRVRPGSAFAGWVTRDSGWPGVAGLLGEMERTGSALGQLAPEIILEYDLIAAPERAPGIFLANLHLPPDRAGVDVLVPELARAAGWPPEERESALVSRIVAALPPAGLLAHLGAMPGRRPRAMRVAARVPWADAPAFLERIGWSGALPPRLDARQAPPALTGELSPECNLMVDVTDGRISPGLGIELFAHRALTDESSAAWVGLVDFFVAEGWCLPGKARRLKAPLLPQLTLTGAGMRVLRVILHHFKTNIDPRGGVAAKAYARADFQGA